MKAQLLKEITINTSRASGPGGQHVNRTESRVELQWNIEHSEALSDLQKTWLSDRIGRRFSETGMLILVSQRSRSQLKNREDVTQRFLNLVEANISPPVARRATRPSRKAHEKRLGAKKQQSEKKDRRSTDWKKEI